VERLIGPSFERGFRGELPLGVFMVGIAGWGGFSLVPPQAVCWWRAFTISLLTIPLEGLRKSRGFVSRELLEICHLK